MLNLLKKLNKQVAYLTNKLYGRHSEKMVDSNQLSLLDDAFLNPEQTGEQSEETIKENKVQSVKRHRRTRNEIIREDLPIEETTVTRKE